MRKRRLLLIASLPLTVAIILGVLAMLPPRPPHPSAIETFNRVEIGMTLAEVQGIFSHEGTQLVLTPDGRKQTWEWKVDGQTTMYIDFYDGMVDGKAMTRLDTFLDKLRRWLHLD
jgi:hypothetical protein